MLPNYATDLLHAHQIRRENVFLHKELEARREDHAEIRSEIKQIKAACNTSIDKAKQAHDLTIIHQSQLNEQAQLISHLQDTNEALQIELDLLRKRFEQFRCDEQHQQSDLEAKVKKLEEGAIKASDTHLLSTTEFWKRLNGLDTAMENVVDLVIDRLSFLGLIPHSSSSSTSCIVESIEQQVPSPHESYRTHSNSSRQVSRQVSVGNRAHSEVQVEDSQKLGTRKSSRVESFRSLDPNMHEHGRETTGPEEVDLDANAPTISYAGHHYPKENIPQEEDALQMLPELSVQPSKLAMINTLRQGRYEDWSSYHGRGAGVRESLPQTFETAILQRFVDGILGEIQRSQCLQWLGNEGWNWENITRFGNICSQIDRLSPSDENSASLSKSRPMAIHPGAQDKVEGSNAKMEMGPPSKPARQVKQPKLVATTVRRSQRLIEKSQTKLINDMEGNIGSAGSKPQSGDKGQDSRHVKENAVCSPGESVSEMSKTPSTTGRAREAIAHINTNVGDNTHGPSQTETQPDVQEVNSVFLKRPRMENDTSPDMIDLPPPKRSRTQTSRQAQGGQEETKQKYNLLLTTPPEIPILPTSTDV